MTKVLATLRLYVGENKRKTPFRDGYRPLFKIDGVGLTSGMIALMDRTEIAPGDEAIVEIRFLSSRISKGDKLCFYEAAEPLGECVVLQILDADTAS